MVKTATARKRTTPAKNGRSPGRNAVATGVMSIDDRLALAQKTLELTRLRTEQVLLENSMSFFGSMPSDPYGVWADKVESEIGWRTIGIDGDNGKRPSHPKYGTHENILVEVSKSRVQEKENPFARCLYENRINYIVGAGTSYKIRAANTKSRRSRFAKSCNEFVKDWIKRNVWDELEQEIIHRTDRDGDFFGRNFKLANGMTEVRTVEYYQVKTPSAFVDDPNVSFGIRFDPQDGAKPTHYYVFYGEGENDYDVVPADEMIHFKGNVDSNCARGLPIVNSCYKELEWADKLLRNMCVITTVQASVAMIRKHGNTKPDVVKDFRSSRDITPPGMPVPTGPLPFSSLERAGEPRIWDATQGFDYEFPVMQVDVSKIVSAEQAALRAVAASVQMPEFMLTADASNANYSSSMVSEGPAVRSFGRAQRKFGNGFKRIIGLAILWAVRSGRITAPKSLRTLEDLDELIEIELGHPPLTTKKTKEETDRRKTLKDEQVMSLQKWCEEEDLDYDTMQKEIKEHMEALTKMFADMKMPNGMTPYADPVTGRAAVAQPPAPAGPGPARTGASSGGDRPGRPRSSQKPRPSRGT